MFIFKFLILLFPLFTFSFASDTLSLSSYLSIAISHNPQLRIASANVNSSIADKKQSFSKCLPQVSFQANAGQSFSYPSSPQNPSLSNSYTAGITAQQQIFDFGKTYFNNKASTILIGASINDADYTLQTVLLNARLAYFNFLLQQRFLEVALDAVTQMQAHLQQATMLFEVGKQAHYAVTKAEVDVANASVSLITAKNNLRLAKVQMDVASGKIFQDSLILLDSLNISESDITFENAIDQAFKNRPELISAKLQHEATVMQLNSVKATYFPELSTSAQFGYRNTQISDWNQNAGISLTLSAPLFSGGSILASVEKAKLAVEKSQASIDAIMQNIRSDIGQAYLQKVEATARIIATTKLIDQAIEAMQLSKERFNSGVATSLEVTDAEITFSNAKSSHVQALFDYRSAHSKLLAAIGILTQ